MKIQFAIALISLSLSSYVFADEAKDRSMFENHKKEMLQNIEERISIAQKEKDCAIAAQDREALKKCREVNREQIDSLREKRMEHHKQRLDEKIKNLQEQKEKMSAEQKKK